jgi:hypothetical protein
MKNGYARVSRPTTIPLPCNSRPRKRPDAKPFSIRIDDKVDRLGRSLRDLITMLDT